MRPSYPRRWLQLEAGASSTFSNAFHPSGFCLNDHLGWLLASYLLLGIVVVALAALR